MTSGAGSVRIPIPIPSHPSLIGASPVWAVLVLDGGGQVANVASLTNAVLTSVGP